ncbi:hypothetical protein TrLO_g15458 [Triparma laevis f. longispina]|uniref:Uncharacterized protein n=1 Tax=Triparma laevis f. longispina TaxID=1714387 RepID=A0A9W7CEZ0_9STRA|nr:hypothetical protein TrLO_g15458 [Triparma laevis f. longispina]
MNNVPVFIQGGNWICLDQFFIKTSKQEYYDAILSHKNMGINLLRVWGGGITENKEFYEVCDELGMMVYQEFWMTGDNNGRWAGSYDEPVNVETFKSAIQWTIQSLRKYASLSLYGGGNELYPKNLSPPDSIKQTFYDALNEYDPDRPFILSSMDGGLQGMNMSEHDSGYALAVKDGPYGFLEPGRYFSEPNPGLVNGSDVTILFQPEIGGSSFPRFESYLEMDVGSEFPGEFDSNVPEDWNWHNFEGYSYILSDGSNFDPIYNLGVPKNVKEYAARADIVSRQQYANLFRGFSSKMFEPTEKGGKTAVILWKSQSPWPSFRGFTYDYYGAATGCADGVREGIGGEFQINAFDDWTDNSVKIVNRGINEVNSKLITVNYYDRFGQALTSPQTFTTLPLPPGVSKISGLKYPEHKNVTFIKTEIVDGHTSWSWTREVNGEVSYEYEELGYWRDNEREGAKVDAEVYGLPNSFGDDEYASYAIKLKVKNAIVFAPDVTARDGDGERILPLLTDVSPVILLGEENFVVRVRKEKIIKKIEIRMWAGEMVEVDL